MKPQITEAYAREIYRAGVFLNPDGSMENEYIRMLKEAGYIRKSDLEILIEEAEKKYNQWNGNESHIVKNRMIEEYYNCIQAMKSEIEKLKKS